ncbi:MAG: UbiA prenyltransferase family protein [Acidimicrobiales bacterium]
MRAVLGLSRPPVVLILAMFGALGLAEATGHGIPGWPLVRVLAVVVGFVLFSAALNDLADEPIDRVNLPGDRRRPLVTGDATAMDMRVIAAVGGAIALVAAALTDWRVLVVAGGGLALSAAYSLRPLRLADRGALASLVLPGAYVAVPYLAGLWSAGNTAAWSAFALLPGLYAGFVGRIVLKDFRDIRGDRLFGKRTFVVRHGRRATCWFSAACWVVGLVWISIVKGSPFLGGVMGIFVVAVLLALRALAAERGFRQDERLIAAIAILGRGLVLSLLAFDAALAALWRAAGVDALVAALLLVSLGQARSMVRTGPTGFQPRVPPAASVAEGRDGGAAETVLASQIGE